MAFDVFISYSSKDKTTANAVCAALETSGIRCWIAPRDINAGTEYAASIIEGIDACRVMVLIFSSSANASPQIHREIERAVSKALTIIPFRIEDVLPTKAMEYYLGSIHWLDALTPPVAKYIGQLKEQVKANLQLDAAASATPDTPFRKTATEKAPFRDYRSQAKRSYLPFALIASVATMGLLVASVLLLWNFRSLLPRAVERSGGAGPANPSATASGLTIRRTQPFGGDGGAAFDDSDSNPAHLPLSALSIIVNLNPADTTQRIIGGLQAQWAGRIGLLHGAKGPFAQPAMAVKFDNNEKIGKVIVNAVSYHFPAAVPPTWIAGLEIWTDVRVYTLGDMTLAPAKQTAGVPSQCLLDYGETLLGFFGRSGSYIDQIGCIIGKPK
jgi:TIR domain/Jacalin-like lectin domain